MPIQNLHLRSNVQGKEPVAGSATGQLPVGSIAINYNKDEPFLSIQDSDGNIRRIAGIKVGATAPATPSGGEAWLDTTITTKPVFKVFDGTAWQGAGSGVSTGGTAPGSPLEGDLWVDTSVSGSPVLKVYDGTAWVAVAPDATTTVKGIVQLADAAAVTAGTVGRAVTADQLKATNDNISAASVWTRTGTDLGPTTAGDSVTTTGAIEGSDLTTTNVVSAAVLATDATGKIIAGTPGSVPDATEAVKGIAELATQAETDAGTDDQRIVTPLKLSSSPLASKWQRTGTTLSPKTAGDSLDMGSFNVDGSAPADSVNVDSSGKLLVGTSTSPTDSINILAKGPVGGGDGAGCVGIGYAGSSGPGNGSTLGVLRFTASGNTTHAEIRARQDGATWTDGSDQPSALTFSTTADGAFSPTERMRITSAGQTLVQGGSVGPLTSDERLKTDIVDAPSQWDDIKAIRLTKFRYKNNPTGTPELGPIAQELEKVCPGLIVRRSATQEEINDDSNNLAEGDEVITYKMTVLYMKAVKALQEAMERIETLETRIAALEVTP